MSINRFAKRRDGNEKELVAIARAFGALWLPVGPLDGWILYRQEWFPVEIKNTRGRYTEYQKKFIAECEDRRAKVFTWRTERDVFETLGAA